MITWDRLGAICAEWREQGGALGAVGRRRVGLLVADPLAMAASVLGALAAGVPVAPLNPGATAAELVEQADVLGLSAVVSDLADSAVVAGLDTRRTDLWATGSRGLYPLSVGGARPGPAAIGDTAMILASSGTTGRAKIIPLSGQQLLGTAAAVVQHHDIRPDDRGYSPLPLSHINALVVGVFSTLVAGSGLILDRRFSARRFWTTVSEHHATWLNLVPAMITVLAGQDGPPAATRARIRFARSASAPLAPAAMSRFEDRCGISVLETYGMTEAASQICANPLAPGSRRPGSVGRPVGVELRVVDSERHRLPAEAEGHIEIRGDHVTRCYWSPEGSSPAVRSALSPGGWLPTGDLGRLDGDGFLYLVGRADDVINRGGEKVYPGEIEQVLLSDPEVIAAIAVGRANETVGNEPVAFVIARPGADQKVLASNLARRCDAALSRFKRPVEITVAESLPSGPTGKILRAEVRNLAAARITGARVTAA